MFNRIVLAMFVALMVACGGGGGDSSTPDEPKVLQGVFIDSPVSGLSYTTNSQQGKTNANGEFNYIAGEKITFTIAGKNLPPVSAKSLITLLDFSDFVEQDYELVNIGRLLQSLDTDSGDNIITLPDLLSDETLGSQIDFSLLPDDFEVSQPLLSLLDVFGFTEVVSEEEAIEHIQNNLELNGVSFGTFDFDNDAIPASQDDNPFNANEVADTDGDNIPDTQDNDNDNDGVSDDVETQQGSDPLDADSTPEVDDGADNDLDGDTDEGFDADGDGFTPIAGGDCNDNNAAIYPNATEQFNNQDDDCDGDTDEALNSTVTVSFNPNDFSDKSMSVVEFYEDGQTLYELLEINEDYYTLYVNPLFIEDDGEVSIERFEFLENNKVIASYDSNNMLMSLAVVYNKSVSDGYSEYNICWFELEEQYSHGVSDINSALQYCDENIAMEHKSVLSFNPALIKQHSSYYFLENIQEEITIYNVVNDTHDPINSPNWSIDTIIFKSSGMVDIDIGSDGSDFNSGNYQTLENNKVISFAITQGTDSGETHHSSFYRFLPAGQYNIFGSDITIAGNGAYLGCWNAIGNNESASESLSDCNWNTVSRFDADVDIFFTDLVTAQNYVDAFTNDMVNIDIDGDGIP